MHRRHSEHGSHAVEVWGEEENPTCRFHAQVDTY
jgi:hypothetical protein